MLNSYFSMINRLSVNDFPSQLTCWDLYLKWLFATKVTKKNAAFIRLTHIPTDRHSSVCMYWITWVTLLYRCCRHAAQGSTTLRKLRFFSIGHRITTCFILQANYFLICSPRWPTSTFVITIDRTDLPSNVTLQLSFWISFVNWVQFTNMFVFNSGMDN